MLTVRAIAALGTFIAALVGIWRVTPIINDRIQQQERLEETQERAVTLLDTHPVTAVCARRLRLVGVERGEPSQQQRIDEKKHIQALNAVIEVAMLG